MNITETAKEILDANVRAKQAQDDPMQKLQGVHVTDVGHMPTKDGETNPDYTKGVPRAKAPGKTANANADSMPKAPADAKTIANTDVKQYDDTDLNAWVNGSPAKLPAQTFDTNQGNISFSGKTDIASLFKGESVSPEFIESAKTLFEVAVADRVNEIVTQIESELNEQFDKAIEEAYTELYEQTDAYMNHFINEWIEANQPVLESNIRSELAENFMARVADLFEEFNIDINEENIDIVEGLTAQVSELEQKLQEATEINAELVEHINEGAMTDIVAEACDGLTQVQAEKLAVLSENITFDSIDDFKEKVGIIKESYIMNGTADVVRASSDQMLTEDASFEYVEEPKALSAQMQSYCKALSLTK